ncbi:MAG: dihydroorotate dehydrogenase electron transfer subunit [Acidobacteriota bacterium]
MAVPVDVHAEVIANTRLSADYNVLVLGAASIAETAQAGQFVMVRTSSGTDPLLRRPFSVFEVIRHADQQSPYALSILCKRVGVGTARLFDAAVGDRLDCLGPLGQPFTPVAPPVEAWMVAGGVGLAPFATLTDSLRSAGTTLRLFYGGRSHTDLFYLDWFEQRGVALDLSTEDGTRGSRGRVTGPLERALAARPASQKLMLYACGPEPMLKAVAALAHASGRPSQVSTERIMGCGMGGCYSCVVRVRGDDGQAHLVRSCLNGPVFNGDAVVWE